MPRFVCAPDSFKGSLSSPEAAAAMAAGVRTACPDATVDACPIADGGEGTVETLVRATAGEFVASPAHDSLGRPITATWGWVGDPAHRVAVVEVAAASGITLLAPAERNPLITSSFGTGELIAAAATAGAERVILGLGGSATNDGGCGAAMALGIQFFRADGTTIDAPIAGGDLASIHRIDATNRRFPDLEILICRDVDNPLAGPTGAAAVYGPQKGADAAAVQRLDAGLAHVGELWCAQLGTDVTTTPGAGAAGGMGGGITAMLGASTEPGIELVLATVGFQERVRGAALCLTGEGQLDGQSLTGKACVGVAQAAQAESVPTVAIVGKLDLEDPAPLAALGMRAVELAPGQSVAESMAAAADLLAARTAEIVASALC